MKVGSAVSLGSKLDKPFRILLNKWGIKCETSGCGTLEAPRTHCEMLMDKETADICQEFVDKL